MALIPILILSLILVILLILAVIDYKTGYLPDIFTFPLAALALIYHWSMSWSIHSLVSLLLGCAAITCFLLGFRYLGNKISGQESFGLGDVKLIAGSTLLLGFVDNIYSIAIGMTLSVIAALIMAFRTKVSLANLSLPLGPGLCAGIMCLLIYRFLII